MAHRLCLVGLWHDRRRSWRAHGVIFGASLLSSDRRRGRSMRVAAVWLFDPLSFPAFRHDRRRAVCGNSFEHAMVMSWRRTANCKVSCQATKTRRQRNVLFYAVANAKLALGVLRAPRLENRAR